MLVVLEAANVFQEDMEALLYTYGMGITFQEKKVPAGTNRED